MMRLFARCLLKPLMIALLCLAASDAALAQCRMGHACQSKIACACTQGYGYYMGCCETESEEHCDCDIPGPQCGCTPEGDCCNTPEECSTDGACIETRKGLTNALLKDDPRPRPRSKAVAGIVTAACGGDPDAFENWLGAARKFSQAGRKAAVEQAAPERRESKLEPLGR